MYTKLPTVYDQDIGSGSGRSKGLAKAQAAVQALGYLNEHYPY